MGKMKNWMMDMEELMGEVMEASANTQESVIAHVKTFMHPVDEEFIKRKLREDFGDAEF
jgi:hypothetical protein